MTSGTGGQQAADPFPESVLEPATSNITPPLARHLTQMESSQTAMRDATKWLVAAAAAVAAVVVAGLQLKNLPQGSLATWVAFLGVGAALVAVAFILYRAAGVLVAGYTTFGHIADLAIEDSYRNQLEQQEKWNKKWGKPLSRYRAMKRGSAPSRRWLGPIPRWYATVAIKVIQIYEGFKIRHAKDEDLRIGELISYLNQDTFYFTQGLAVDINQLYRLLKEADEHILSLRGETSGEDEDAEPASADFSKAKLEKAEWRRDRLESATRVIIVFANQKLLEQRFRKLLVAIFFGGAIVALGAGAFAAAPKLSRTQNISITQPTRVTIRVIGNGLGKLCPPGTLLQGVAVGGNWEEPLVVTEQAGACPAQQMTLDHSQAIAVPVLGS